MKTNCSPTSPKSGSLDSNENRAERTEAEQLTINAAEQSQLQNDSAAEAAYQTAMDGYAETQAMSDAAATLTYNDAIDTALTTQSNADAAAAQTYAHNMNGFTQQYYLAMGDAYAAEETSFASLYSNEEVTIDNAAASAWTAWASSANSPYATYEAAYNAASYDYYASLSTIYASASFADTAAMNQWNHDVAGGWLTYQNDLADHAKTDNDSVTSAAKTVTDALAADANTFATTVIPAIQTAADAEIADGKTAILTGSSAGLTDANTKAGDTLTAVDTRIAAAQAVNDAIADAANRYVMSTSAADAVLAASDANAIGYLTQHTTTLSPNAVFAPQDKRAAPGNAVAPLPLDQFAKELKEIVDASKLHEAPGELFKGDKDNWWVSVFGYFKVQLITGKPGCDCDDFAFMMNCWLKSSFSEDAGVTLSYVHVEWIGSTSGSKQNAHYMNVVQRGGKYYVVDAEGGTVSPPCDTLADVEAAVAAILQDPNGGYKLSSSAKFTFEFQSNSTLPQKLNDPEPFYTDPELRQGFLNTMRKRGVDISKFEKHLPGAIIPVEATFSDGYEMFGIH